MSYREALSNRTMAISTSESPDMLVLGLSNQHLRDAMAEIARHLLACGATLAYGGDLRKHGFTKLLFELVARSQRDVDEDNEKASVLNYLAWPVHIQKTVAEIDQYNNDLAGTAALIFLDLEGRILTKDERMIMPQVQPSEKEWVQGLTSMRKVMCDKTDARIILGGRVENYKGSMPGIAQEALFSLQAKQPLFLIGGFGGCTRDIAETLNLIYPWRDSPSAWAGREMFENFAGDDLNNGLSAEENATLARTSHIDQAIALILSGLLRQK
ncbi:MAG: hypothetical protein HQK55_02860 [Deltaproteobacteria bacterium]|nr:hypothetical protein [Deltaproteobacteria bacterium]